MPAAGAGGGPQISRKRSRSQKNTTTSDNSNVPQTTPQELDGGDIADTTCSISLDHWGSQILDAISHAKDEILCATTYKPAVAAGTAPIYSPISPDGAPVFDNSSEQLNVAHSHSHPAVSAGTDNTPSNIANAEDILRWEIFQGEPFNHYEPPSGGFWGMYEPERSATQKASADTSLACLQKLKQQFEQKFLLHYPIVRPAHLNRWIRSVAESGGDWNAESCLVFLVCALASLCSCGTMADTVQMTDGSPWSTMSQGRSSFSSGIVSRSKASQSAYQYWTMAKRRIGWALDNRGGLIGPQCLCLAGFWHLQSNAPLKARNMFQQAADSAQTQWRSLHTSEDERSLAIFLHLLSLNQHR
ncbi:hypothetical protein LTR84_010550 [Exophiala bonariae]|uniref:Transcription factor domain-containing protein n=1 Tax=Exophiala bonariae TaxID=1690606 RepID=A0AAV9MVV7_9EURO|nr:hypothetical protein LTR84_010550 [Exophiala bonariae]